MIQEVRRHQSHKNETLEGNVAWLKNKHETNIRHQTKFKDQ